MYFYLEVLFSININQIKESDAVIKANPIRHINTVESILL
jgi:hypothetical protein